MRARLFALFILLLLVGLPLLAYWYFFTDRIASVKITVPGGTHFSVELQWTLSSDWLPLADKFLVYHQDCDGLCEFSPIPPVVYSLTLTSTGKVTLEDTFVLKTGEKKSLSYMLNDDVAIREFTTSILNDDLGLSLVENANSTLSWTFDLVWVGQKNQIFATRKQGTMRQLWLLSSEKFIPFRSLLADMWEVHLDTTRRFFLIHLLSGRTLILATDMSKEIETILVPTSVVELQDGWKIQTQSGVYFYDSDVWAEENPRFSDFLDISPSKRLWYIAADDTNRLGLSNFAPWESVLVLLNRTNGQNYVVKRWLNIRTLYFDWTTPVYMDTSGRVWEISFDD